MAKQQLTEEQKKTDTDIWIIALVTLAVFLFYAFNGNKLMDFVTNVEISVAARLLVNAGLQFGIAGLGITIVCIFRKERFNRYGLRKESLAKAIIGTVVCFIPSILYIMISGQFEGYHPFGILITKDVLGKRSIVCT